MPFKRVLIHPFQGQSLDQWCAGWLARSLVDCMNEWMVGQQMNGRLDNGWIGGWMDGWIDSLIYGWICGLMHGGNGCVHPNMNLCGAEGYLSSFV